MSPDDAAAVFAAERPRLVGLAYRLLGGVADAEDVVQEAWFRWAAADHPAIERPAAWLTTVVSRLGLDRLRAVQRARVDYVGPWLPEPLVEPFEVGDRQPGSRSVAAGAAAPGGAGADPADHAVLADSLTTAFLVLLEQLSPEERLVVLLVDVFGEPFHVAATAVGRSADATRQLAVRARRKLRQADTGATRRTSPSEALAIATQFVGAVMSGDLEAVRAMLTDDAVLVSDGGPRRHAARRPVVGPDRIARFVVNIGRRAEGQLTFDPVWVNGRPGVVVKVHGAPYMVTAVDVVGDRISRYWSFLNPDKLGALDHHVDLV